MDNLLVCPQGQFSLKRLPQQPRELLQAWDAADEYLLEHIAGLSQLPEQCRTLIINDNFGALAVALNPLHPCAISDSYLSQQATRRNLQLNGLNTDGVVLTGSLTFPDTQFDLVVFKIPRTLALLEDELLRLRPLITADSQIIIAGMVKGMPASVWKIIEKIIGPTTTSLARKKARLIFVTPDLSLALPNNPYPACYTLEETQYRICNHANVFSRESLDIGTRLFLKHIPANPDARDIIDLGCGNGVVGLIAAERNPATTIHFVDESHMALASARENFREAFGPDRAATFVLGDGLTDLVSDSAELVLCNPPFHQQSVVGDFIAQRMFRDAKRVLQKGGELWIVGNRHLGYHNALKQLFGNVTLIDSNKKFVILKSRKV